MMPSWLDGGETASSVFTKRSKAPAVLRALEAATEALERFEALNKARKERGRVQVRTGCIWASFTYGNVGATDRLDFTVIGPAVNLATRIEGLTKRLFRPLLTSCAVAEMCPRPLVSVGSPVTGTSIFKRPSFD